MARTIALIIILMVGGLAGAPVAAEPITDRAAFLALVEGRVLSRTGVRLSVSPDGTISGRAFGRDVGGKWQWSKDFFCRELTWGGAPFDSNCQSVSRQGAGVRFTSDLGQGRYADFALR